MKQQAKKKVGSITEPGFAGTNPQKVKQEIPEFLKKMLEAQ